MKKSVLVVLMLVVALAALLLFTGGGAEGDLIFWTTDAETDRMEQQREIASDFAAIDGVEVRVEPVFEKDLNHRMATQRSAGLLPHVVRAGIEHVVGYERDDLLDVEAATAVIRELGVDSFAPGALAPVRRGDKYLAVPVDGWAQGIWYRKDLFEQKNLAAPDNWDAILKAAEALTVREGEGKRFGIALPRHPSNQYPQQVFEQFAMSAGAKLFAEDGSVQHQSPEIRRTVAFWKKLAAFSPGGSNVDPKMAQLCYLGGKAAMVFYSPYILDDIAGQSKHKDILAMPDLSKRTGFAPVISERAGGKWVGYGQLVYLNIMKEAPSESRDWVKHLLGDAYMKICFMSAGGKVPVRPAFLAEWKAHPCFELYEPDIPERLVAGMNASGRWGFRAGGAYPIIAEIYGKHVFAKALDDMVTHDLSVDEVMKRIDENMKPILEGAAR